MVAMQRPSLFCYNNFMSSFIVCNWKTYINTEFDAIELASNIDTNNIKGNLKVVVCPSALHLSYVRISKGEKIFLGAQDISTMDEKPSTGRSSGEQLSSLGVTYVIVGHAETRLKGVTNKMVAEKTMNALQTNLIPIVCLSEQKGNEKELGDEVASQLEEIFSILKKHSVKNLESVLIAYEPIEHIGGDSALPTREIEVISGRLKNTIKKFELDSEEMPILYGGSVDDNNIEDIKGIIGINGFLIGRASIDRVKINNIISSF